MFRLLVSERWSMSSFRNILELCFMSVGRGSVVDSIGEMKCKYDMYMSNKYSYWMILNH